MKKFIFLLAAVLLFSCTENTETEKSGFPITLTVNNNTDILSFNICVYDSEENLRSKVKLDSNRCSITIEEGDAYITFESGNSLYATIEIKDLLESEQSTCILERYEEAYIKRKVYVAFSRYGIRLYEELIDEAQNINNNETYESQSE